MTGGRSKTVLSLILAGTMILTASAAVAQAKKENEAAAQPQAPQIPWLVNCAAIKDRSACEVVQRLTIRRTGQLLLSISVRLPEGSKTPTMLIQLPHGLFIPEGVFIKIDSEDKKKHQIQTCDTRGCYVGMPIDEKLLAQLFESKALTVEFKNLAKKDIQIPIALSGFAEAYKKL